MDQVIVSILGNLQTLGIGGLFFVMWWMERRDKETAIKDKDEARELVKDCTTAINNNSEVIRDFRDEMRTMRTQLIPLTCSRMDCGERKPIGD